MGKQVYCCKLMELFLNDRKVPLKYYPILREYGLDLLYSYAIQLIQYCPWCGKKLPKSLGDEYFDILEKEHGITPELDIQNDPNIPEEFKSDEWWKKRKL